MKNILTICLVALSMSAFGQSFDELIADYNKLMGMRQFSLAAGKMESAVEIAKSRWGENNDNTATAYTNLGFAYQSAEVLSMAEGAFNMAMLINRQLYGDNSPLVAYDYSNVAQLYYQKGEFDKAINYYEQMLGIQEGVYGENSEKLVDGYYSLGAAHVRNENLSKAEALFNKALANKLGADPDAGKDDKDLYRIYKGIYNIYKETNRKDEAEALAGDWGFNKTKSSGKIIGEDEEDCDCIDKLVDQEELNKVGYEKGYSAKNKTKEKATTPVEKAAPTVEKAIEKKADTPKPIQNTKETTTTKVSTTVNTTSNNSNNSEGSAVVISENTNDEGDGGIMVRNDGIYHKVKSGETLFSIAQKYKVKVDEINKLNKLSTQSTIKAGDVIRIM